MTINLITLDGPEGAGKGTQSEKAKKFLEKQGHKVLNGLYEPGSVSVKAELIRVLLKNQHDKEEFPFPGDFGTTFNFEKYQDIIQEETLPDVASTFIENAIKSQPDNPKKIILEFLLGNKGIKNAQINNCFANNPSFLTLQTALKEYSFTAEEQGNLFFAARSLMYHHIPKLMKAGSYTYAILDRSAESTTVYQGHAQDPSLVDQIRENNCIAMQGIIPKATILLDVPVEVSLERITKRGDKGDWFQDKIEKDPQFGERIRVGYLNESLFFSNLPKDHPLKKSVYIVDGNRTREEVSEDIQTILKYK